MKSRKIDFELIRAQTPRARYARVDLDEQRRPLLVVERTDVDAGGSREVGEAIVRA